MPVVVDDHDHVMNRIIDRSAKKHVRTPRRDARDHHTGYSEKLGDPFPPRSDNDPAVDSPKTCQAASCRAAGVLSGSDGGGVEVK